MRSYRPQKLGIVKRTLCGLVLGLTSILGCGDSYVNNPPVLNPIGNKVVNEKETLEFIIEGSDVDVGDVLTYSYHPFYPAPNNPNFDSITGEFSWTPNYFGSQPFDFIVRFKVTDNEGAEDFEDVTIKVNNVPCYRIAFVSDGDLNIINEDGSGQRNLTSGRDINERPIWSPNGEKIIFVDNSESNREIYKVNPDGTNLIRLTNNVRDDYSPNYSSDGFELTFTSDRDANDEIYTMNPDGINQTNRTNESRNDRYSSYSPDGSQIVFNSARDVDWEVYVMDKDGSNPINRTNNPFPDNRPVWSPNGNRIAFESMRDSGTNLYHIKPDGTDLIKLTNNLFENCNPIWFSDNLRLVFLSDRTGASEVYDIFTINSDGSLEINLTNSPLYSDENPSLCLDNRIAFGSDRSGDYNIYIMNPDGTEVIDLTKSTTYNNNYPSWSPDKQ